VEDTPEPKRDDEAEGQDNEAQEAKSDDAILAEALARFKLAEEAETEIRRLALEDLQFRAGNQWPEEVRAERDRDRRPCLTINRIPQFIQQITNDQRQNRPSIKVHPIDDQADIETGKVIQGITKHIEYNSNADVAYDTAFDSAVTGGFGYFRVITDYISPKSFDQEIFIKRIRNPFSVFFDPYAQEPDGSDANWCFIIDDLSSDEYKAKYKDSELASLDDWESIGNHTPGWVKEGHARVAEYFYREYKEETLVLLNNGESGLKSQLTALPEGVTIVQERTTRVPTIYWCKINAVEILEKTEWLGEWIPVIPVYGTELVINGKRTLEGIVRNAKDSQRMYNYWSSAETEAVALAPRAPFIAAEGQLEGHEREWQTANVKNHAVLKYKPVSAGGQPIGPPQRNVFEPAVQAITNARMLAADDLKATTGIYDASLGAKGNETSGIAIQRRNIQAQTSNFHFVDNLTRSLRHAGRILVDLIPKIYDTARAARIIGDDGEQKIVQVNRPFDQGGKPVLYQLDAGKYDVAIDVGPSFTTKRQEAAASMLEMSKAYPAIAQVAGDLIVKSMDWPGAQEIADRLKKTLPPGIADDPANKGQTLPPEVQAQMSQMNQMIQQLTEKLNIAHDKIDNKTLELESRERIEFAKIEADIQKTLAQIDSKESITLLQQEVASVRHRLELLDYSAPIEGAEPQGYPQDQMEGHGGEMPAGEPSIPQPTGGLTPGQPMEGMNTHVDPSQNL